MAIDTAAKRGAAITFVDDTFRLVVPSGSINTAPERASVVGGWQPDTATTGGSGGRWNRARRVASWMAVRKGGG